MGGGLNLIREGEEDGGETSTQWLAGVGVGVRMPISDNAFMRLEGDVDRHFVQRIDDRSDHPGTSYGTWSFGPTSTSPQST